MHLTRLLPFYGRYEAAMSRVAALEMAFAKLLESPRYEPSEAVGFNGQVQRKQIFSELAAAFAFDLIVETGTFFGDTAGYMATNTHAEIHTCEVSPVFSALARSRLAQVPNIHFHVGDSRAFIDALIKSRVFLLHHPTPVFFYLDAHWHDDLPLKDELALIANSPVNFVIMVDDFCVPDDPGYNYDDYGKNKSLDLATFANCFRRLNLVPFFPAQPSATETGGKRGCVVLTRLGSFCEQARRLVSLRLLQQ